MRNGRWSGSGVARAEDEGLVQIFVPLEYKGDWKHFLGVVSHLFLNDSPEFTVAKARQLVTQAHKPHAPLADISLCWEALGPDIIPTIAPLLTDPDPDIAYAATRAAAFLGDIPARHELLRIAGDYTQHYQIEAVQTLGALPNSPDTFHMLRTLLSSDKADVRIEAYRILAEANDESIISNRIGDSFYMDMVPGSGPPLVYATTTGVPRIAIFGHNLALRTPITFTAMDERFTSFLQRRDESVDDVLSRSAAAKPGPLAQRQRPGRNRRPTGRKRAGSGQHLHFQFQRCGCDRAAPGRFARCLRRGFSGRSMAALFRLEHPQLATESWTSIPQDTEAGRPQGGGMVGVPTGPVNAVAAPATQPAAPKTAGAEAASGVGG